MANSFAYDLGEIGKRIDALIALQKEQGTKLETRLAAVEKKTQALK